MGMTNGEKFKEVFKPSQVDEGDYFAFARWSNYHAAEISIGWWNAEYKEPTTKNDLGVDCISRQFMYELGATCIATRNEKTGNLIALGAIEELPSVTPQEPIKALGEELRKVREGIKDEKVLIGFNMAIAISNKHLGGN